MRYTCPEEKELIHRIALDLGMPSEEILQIVAFQRDYVKHTMEHSGFQGVMLAYLGKFFVKPGRLQMLNNRQDGIIRS